MEEQKDTLADNGSIALTGDVSVPNTVHIVNNLADNNLVGNSNISLGSNSILGRSTSSWGSNGAISPGRVTINPDFAMQACLEHTVDKHFEDRSEECKNSIKEMFRNKTEEERMQCLLNMFTHQSLEFFKDMSDAELINFLRISC